MVSEEWVDRLGPQTQLISNPQGPRRKTTEIWTTNDWRRLHKEPLDWWRKIEYKEGKKGCREDEERAEEEEEESTGMTGKKKMGKENAGAATKASKALGRTRRESVQSRKQPL